MYNESSFPLMEMKQKIKAVNEIAKNLSYPPLNKTKLAACVITILIFYLLRQGFVWPLLRF